MHINWTVVMAFGALSVFVSYLPAPGKGGITDAMWYAPTFHTLQWIALNWGRSTGLLKNQNDTQPKN